MKTIIFVFALLLPATLMAQVPDQILRVITRGDTVVYAFANKRNIADLSGIPIADAKFIMRTFWSQDKSDGTLSSVKIISTDSTEQAAILGQLATFGITPTTLSIKPTAQQQADVIWSQLQNKEEIIKFLLLVGALRADNPTLSSMAVRCIAKGGL